MSSKWHALACLLISAPILLAGDEQPELDNLMKTASANYMKGDYDAARQSYEQAWKLIEAAPANSPVRYDILKRLAAVRTAAGQFAEADSYLQQAINWRELNFGVDDPVSLNDLLEVSSLCRATHDYNRALAILERVRDAHVRAGGYETAVVAADLSRIAQIHLDLSKPENAASVLTTALEINAKVYGQDHPALLQDLDRLGEVLITLRQYDKAEEVYRRDLVIRERVFGKDNANLITTVDGLAYAYFGEKKYEQAEPQYQRLVSLWANSAGNDHPMVALALDKMTVFYRDQKKSEEARNAADRAIAIRAHFLATGLAQQALQRISDGTKDEGELLYRRALAVLDPPHPVFEELRNQIQNNVKEIEASRPKPRRKKSSPSKK